MGISGMVGWLIGKLPKSSKGGDSIGVIQAIPSPIDFPRQKWAMDQQTYVCFTETKHDIYISWHIFNMWGDSLFEREISLIEIEHIYTWNKSLLNKKTFMWGFP